MKILPALAAALLLAACGQTGPLRTPEPKSAATAPAAVTPAEAPAAKLKTSPTP